MSVGKMHILIGLSLVLGSAVTVIPAKAQDTEEFPFYRAEVIESLEKGVGDFGPFERLKVRIIGEGESGKEVEIEAGDTFERSASHDFTKGDLLVIRKDESGDFVFVERYRLSAIIVLLIIFCGLCVLVGGKRGFYGLIGLAVSVALVAFYLIPQIASGSSIYHVGFVALACIAVISVTIAHGFHKTTAVALSGISITLLISAIFSGLVTRFSAVYGLGTETPFQVHLAGLSHIDFRGLFLVGVLMGALGVLDDVTTAQATVVSELKKANPRLTRKQLYTGAAKVGQEHIVSMINTLFLAYAGISLPFLLLFYVNPMPMWAFLNSEMMAEEIIRTVVGSAAILLSVPLTTAIAAVSYGRVDRPTRPLSEV